MPQRPGDTALGRFFKHSYRVGAEKFMRDIPTLVLLEILAVLLLVIRNGILGLFGEHIPGSDPTCCIRCLWRPHMSLSFHCGTGATCAEVLLLLLFSILIVCVLLLIVGITGHRVLLSNLAGWMIFIVIPVIAFGVDVALLIWVGRLINWRYQRRQARVAAAAAAHRATG